MAAATAFPRGGWFVVGTDTGVGKTLVASALIHALRRNGHHPLPFKPVASGCEDHPDGLWSDDVARLIAASGLPLAQDEVSPYRYLPPIAPHIAAVEAGRAIDLEQLVHHASVLAQRGPLVVEGAGGFLVPVDAQYSLADLAIRLDLPLVLVVGMRLGCLNHALLTVEAIAVRGLRLAGWVANHVDPGFARADSNLQTLSDRLPAPLLCTIPWSASPDPAAVGLHTLPAA